MSNREREIYGPALCAAGCGRPYEKWHRKCNLVFCEEHVAETAHKCRPDEQRGKNTSVSPTAAASLEPVVQPGGGTGVAVQMPIQAELFVTPPEPPPSTNGTVQ